MVTTKDGHFRSELARCRSAWTSCRSRPILIGRREGGVPNSGWIPQARGTLLRRREPRGRRARMLPSAGTRRNTVSRSGSGILDALDSRRDREAAESAFHQATGAAFTIEQSRRAAQSARWECLTSDPKREIIVLSGGSQFCSPTRCCPRLLAHSLFFVRQLRFLRIRNP